MKNSNIFLNYRRSSNWEAFSVYSALTKELGDDKVFIDLEIAPSDLFKEKIENEINNSHFFVIIISQKWIDTFAIKEKENQFDFVKFEIELALKNNKYIIPILFNNAKFPSQKKLPQSIRKLGQFNAISIEPFSFYSSMDILIALIKDENKNNLAPKKILSIDSSLYDGLIIIEILKALENRIRLLTNDDKITIQDYFDLITSSGGISGLITILLYKGMTVNEIYDVLFNTLPSTFDTKRRHSIISVFKGSNHYSLNKKRINNLINKIFGSSVSNLEINEKSNIDFCIVFYNITKDSFFPFSLSEDLNGLNNERIEGSFLRAIESSLYSPKFILPIFLYTSITKDRLIGAGWVMPNPVLPVIDFIKSKSCFQNYKLGTSSLFVTSIGTGEKQNYFGDNKNKGTLLNFAFELPKILVNRINENSESNIENLAKTNSSKNKISRGDKQGALSYQKIYIPFEEESWNRAKSKQFANSEMINPHFYQEAIQQEILKFNLPKVI